MSKDKQKGKRIYHVHVYKLESLAEVEIETCIGQFQDEEECEIHVQKKALALAKAGKLEFGVSDNTFIALLNVVDEASLGGSPIKYRKKETMNGEEEDE